MEEEVATDTTSTFWNGRMTDGSSDENGYGIIDVLSMQHSFGVAE
jgi:hypothetical protein